MKTKMTEAEFNEWVEYNKSPTACECLFCKEWAKEKEKNLQMAEFVIDYMENESIREAKALVGKEFEITEKKMPEFIKAKHEQRIKIKKKLGLI